MAAPKRGSNGRPKANIDWEEVKTLIQAGCKGTEVAAYLCVDRKTLYDRCMSDLNLSFSAFYRQNINKGDAMLKVAGFQAALKGADNSFYASNLIFMLKSRLGLSDKPKEDNTASAKIILTKASDASQEVTD